MEKYAVDLDKVLDELEFNEDRAEQLASVVTKRTTNGTTPHIGYGPATRKSSAPSMHYRRPAFEPINLADADFAAAPQPSASYVESSYVPQMASHHEVGQPDSHWQQNGLSTPHINNMISSLSEFGGDNKRDLNHSQSLWIQNNVTDNRNLSKGKSEKRNGSLDVFISNVTLNSGGHVSECNTADGLYYNEINKSSETSGESDISHKQDIRIKRNNVDTGVLGNRIYNEYLSKNFIKNDIPSATSNVICEPYSVNTGGLECQTSESGVMGVDISCEAEGLECNSSNPCKDQKSDNCARVTENNTFENEVLETKKISESGNCNVFTRVADAKGNLTINKTDGTVDREQEESSTEESVKGSQNRTGKYVIRNLSKNNTETQKIFGAVTPVIGFTSFTDISDEELQQYLQELEEEVENETESLAVQESITEDRSVQAFCIPTACEEQDGVPEVDRRNHSGDVRKNEGKDSLDCKNVSRTAKILEHLSEVTNTSDSPQTGISDVNVMPSDTGPPSSTTLATVPVSSTLQDAIINTASQNSASVLSIHSVTLSDTTPLALLPVAKCDVSHKDTRKRNEITQVVPDSEERNIASCMDNIPFDVTLSTSVSTDIAHSKSTTNVAPSKSLTTDVAPSKSVSTDIAPSESVSTDVSSKSVSTDVSSKSVSTDVSSKSVSTDVSSKSVSTDVVPSIYATDDIAPSEPASANVATSKSPSADVASSKFVLANVASSSNSASADVAPSESPSAEVGHSKSEFMDVSPSKSASTDVGPSKYGSADFYPSKFASADFDPSKSLSADIGPSQFSLTDVDFSKSALTDVGPSKSASADVGPSKSTSADVALSESVSSNVSSSKSFMSVGDPVSMSTDVSAALIQYVLSNTDAAVADGMSSTSKPSSSTSDSGLSGLQQVENNEPENEVPSDCDSSLNNQCVSVENERTPNDSTAELLLEVIAASPPSYQSVIEASNYECVRDKDKCLSPEDNPFSRSEVNVCTERMPEEESSIDVLGEEERPSRPHFLHLPSKINLDDQNVDTTISESPPAMLTYGPPGETPSATPHLSISDNLGSEGTVSSPDLSDTSSVEQVPSDSLSDVVSPEDRTLGKLPPYWVPDADAPSCMLCDLKFTVIKRRHHCRACGKVLCSKCCNLKSRLEYLDNSEARVCQPCYNVLARVYAVEQCESASGSPSLAREASTGISTALGRRPNPNNPMEYCSTIPPMEQAASTLRQPPPSVLVPVGVLKREGSARSKSDVTKQVMFSDGIRPGGDLTELDGSSEPRMPYRRPGRVLKRVGTPPGTLPMAPQNHSTQHKVQPVVDPKTNSFIPENGLPPIVTLLNGDVRYEEDYESNDRLMETLKSESELPVVFAINRNFFVQVKILNLDCCVNRTCWCFTTLGLRCVGQDEVLVVLECLPGEAMVPRDVFLHLNSLYQEASRGVTVGELGYTVVQRSNFLGSLDHGGFIYVRPSYQCLHKLVLPPEPYLVAILIHRWETPWARLFPIRLMLRLGAEFRYYPCMLVSIRQRKPVYCEIGHTIMNLLADFRNLSYTLPSVRGLVIHMEDRQTSILLPKNRYDQVMRALNNSNDHVLAFAANFSHEADSHLVCIQGTEDESYHTQAINIHTKPRKVTGASFVVFNGALKSALNLTAKSSIVEDGLMVQITADDMVALRTALRNMADFTIGCGPSGAPAPDELVLIKWVADDKNFNIGVQSCIDTKCLDGVPSIRVHNGTDYVGSSRFIRWTEVFIIQSEDGSGQSGDPLDISRLSESIAQATCLALVQLLDSLAQAGLTMLAVRANIHPDSVGYEAGSGGERLAPIYMNSLDNELVPVLHKAASTVSDSPAAILELVFHVMLQ